MALILLNFIPPEAKGGDPAFNPLVTRLIGDGLDSLRIQRLFNDPRITFLQDLVKPNMNPQDNPDAYRKFDEDDQVDDGVDFLLKWDDEITRLVRGTSIPSEIIVAMLKIESDLGRNAGDHLVLAVFATLSSLADRDFVKMQTESSGTVDSEQLRRRAERRARWAYRELLAFLDICDQYGWDPLEIRGSWAGAFGAAQFLPSSYSRCGRDGDGDGVVDPYNLSDAMAAMICYLKDAGWNENPSSHRAALHRYNPSNAYVDAVLDYADRLKERRRAAPAGGP